MGEIKEYRIQDGDEGRSMIIYVDDATLIADNEGDFQRLFF